MGDRLVIELAKDPRFARDLAAGGAFVPGCALAINADCTLVVRGASEEIELPARVVFLDPQRGAGVEVIGFNAAMKERLVALAEAAAPAAPAAETDEPPAEDEAAPDDVLDEKDPEKRRYAETIHQRLRNLPMPEQIKMAHSGDPQERMILERMYGKNVWEPLLRNSRITAPEVARIARMATLPRTLIEIIVSNGAWIQIGEIRRALLANPRLGVDQVLRILRVMSKPELKLATVQKTYPNSVREAAKRLIKESLGSK